MQSGASLPRGGWRIRTGQPTHARGACETGPGQDQSQQDWPQWTVRKLRYGTALIGEATSNKRGQLSLARCVAGFFHRAGRPTDCGDVGQGRTKSSVMRICGVPFELVGSHQEARPCGAFCSLPRSSRRSRAMRGQGGEGGATVAIAVAMAADTTGRDTGIRTPGTMGTVTTAGTPPTTATTPTADTMVGPEDTATASASVPPTIIARSPNRLAGERAGRGGAFQPPAGASCYPHGPWSDD